MSNASEPSRATVRIPVKIVKGRVMYLHGKKRMPLREGAIGELVLPAQAVQDRDWLTPLRAERVVQIVPTGATLLLAMRLRKAPEALHAHFQRPDDDRLRNFFRPPQDVHTVELPLDGVAPADAGPLCWGDDAFVPVKLIEPLQLILRGTKSAILRGGRCRLPALDREAASLNHAYTLVSEVFEPERRSHTGNVFERVRYFEGTHWRQLDDLRVERQAAYEQLLVDAGSKRTRRAKPAQGTLDFR